MNELAFKGSGKGSGKATGGVMAGGKSTAKAGKTPSPGATAPRGKTDRERFVALAFCRADLLPELDGDYNIAFAAGVTPMLGATPETLQGSSFLDFVGDEHKAYARDLLSGGGRNGRIEDVVMDLQSAGGKRII